ncbi:MAG: class I SAM-dependent methyltransferase [Candidatus Thorarchaeota archaeon]
MNEKTIDYDTVSKIYDQIREGEPEMVYYILQVKTPSSDSRVLDVGCGTGNNTLLFQQATGARMYGLDPSFGMLVEAVRKAPEVEFVQAFAESIPFPAGLFDILFMTEVVHHLSSLELALQEMQRVLKPGGHLCVVTQSHEQIEQRMTSRFFPATVEVDKARYPDIPMIEQGMSNSGFNEVWSNSFKFTPIILGEDYLNTVSRMGYSMLHKIGEEDYQRGLRELRLVYERGEQLDYSAGYTFVWGSKGVDLCESHWVRETP